ncbi:hypothetical protein BRC93_09330 [Halobacteriales archaeon QS_5_70_15]|nr:MAG: hypothetical protein BRC93_09330 [Halobacteriales archaeon QS_5_70_15]
MDRPPVNRRALAGMVLAALIAMSGFFLMPALEWVGVGFWPAFLGISGIEVACAAVIAVSVHNRYPDDYEPEYY